MTNIIKNYVDTADMFKDYPTHTATLFNVINDNGIKVIKKPSVTYITDFDDIQQNPDWLEFETSMTVDQVKNFPQLKNESDLMNLSIQIYDMFYNLYNLNLPIPVARCISVKSVHNIDFNDLGNYWTFYPDEVNKFCKSWISPRLGDSMVVFNGLVDRDNVNWGESIFKYLHYTIFFEMMSGPETELYVIDPSKVKNVRYNVVATGDKVEFPSGRYRIEWI